MTHARFQHEGLVMARAALAPLVTDLEDRAMRVIPRDSETLRLLTRYLATLRNGHAMTPELRHLAATHVHDLVAMAIGATRDGVAVAQDRGLRAARLAAIKADVMAHAGDRDLNLAAVAARHHCGNCRVAVAVGSGAGSSNTGFWILGIGSAAQAGVARREDDECQGAVR
jgi:hypothetical protein